MAGGSGPAADSRAHHVPAVFAREDSAEELQRRSEILKIVDEPVEGGAAPASRWHRALHVWPRRAFVGGCLFALKSFRTEVFSSELPLASCC